MKEVEEKDVVGKLKGEGKLEKKKRKEGRRESGNREEVGIDRNGC